MSTPFYTTVLTMTLLASVAGGRAASLPATSAPVTSAPANLGVTELKSIFNCDPSIGKDPFFPKSTRWAPKKPKEPVTQVVRSEFPEDLVLRGVSGTSGKRLAMLNHYTLAAGEEVDLKSGGQSFKVRCVEVKERSVVVSVRGITRELELRKGL